MKRLSFFLVLAALTVSFGLASGQSIYLDATTGTWDDGGTAKLIPGTPFTATFTLDNSTGIREGGFSNGFRVYGPASFTPIVGDTVNDNGSSWSDVRFTLNFAINCFGCDGAGSDTVGFIGAGFPADMGLAAGEVIAGAFQISTGNVAEGETLCIDSTFFPTTGSWLWGTSGSTPAWDGPHCFLSETPPCLPPTLTNEPASIGGSHCDVMMYDFDAQENDPLIAGYTFSAALGTIDANTGEWSYAPTLADVGASVNETITVSNGTCQTDYVIPINATNEAPVPTCPGGIVNVSADTDANVVLTATDDCDPYSWSVVSGPATVDAGTGVLTINAPVGSGSIVVEVTDGNASNQCTINYEAIAGSLYQVEIPCLGDQESNFVYQGQMVDVPVMFSGPIIGGYDLLVAYDNSALSFQSAEAGAAIVAAGWEYFTYRYGADGNCSNACPSGLLRMTAIAETNNGPNHPDMVSVSGELASMTFLVTNDRTFECQSIPIRFFWLDCGDNALSNWTGDSLLISEFVYDGDEELFPPFGSEIQDFTYGYPTYFGAQDEDCDTDPSDGKAAYRAVSFNNGCVFVACADSIDARGDINLNNVANEIADAVLYSNYFIYGIGVFTVNTEGQIAASDVNADGLTLSVADLVYLIRVIVGDALPYAKLSPVVANVTDNNGILNVDAEMGAALVTIKGNATPTVLAEGMELKYAYDEASNITRALVFDVNGATFEGNFINAGGEVVSVELGAATGATVNAKVLPANFGLAQNYPNPFNPTTTIGFSLPVQSDVTLTIYNITGQKVTSFSGNYVAGNHAIEWDASNNASGVYFYKIDADNFTQTRKMVLMK